MVVINGGKLWMKIYGKERFKSVEFVTTVKIYVTSSDNYGSKVIMLVQNV